MKKRTFARSLAMFMLLALLITCTLSTSAFAAEGGGGSEGEVTRFTVFCPSPSARKAPLDSPVANQIRELYGVEFEWIIPATDGDEQLGIMLAGSDSELPDLIYFDSEPIMNQYIAAGKLVNLDPELREHAPEIIDVNFAEFYDRLKEEDGSVYYLPYYYTVNASEYNFVENTNCLWLKSEYFDETDSWDMLPLKTLADTTELFRKLKERYPDQYPISLALGANGNLGDIITGAAGAAGLNESAHIVLNEDGTLSYLFENEKFKEYFKWLNSLNQEGLLDIESPLLSTESLKEKIVNDQAYSSFAWRYGTLRGPYISYQQSQGNVDKIMFKDYPVVDDSVTQKTHARGSKNIYATGLAATKNIKNLDKFLEFYREANTERGHFNVLGTVNWEFDGENTPEETEGYNFVAMKEPNASGKRPIVWTAWTWEQWDESEDWAHQWGVENFIEFTYNAECAPPNSEFDILEAMTEEVPEEDDLLGQKLYKIDTIMGEAGSSMAYWDFMRSMWVDTSLITNLRHPDEIQTVRNSLDVAFNRVLPRVIMAADDEAFEREWAALMTELESAGYKTYMESVQRAYDERLIEWGDEAA